MKKEEAPYDPLVPVPIQQQAAEKRNSEIEREVNEEVKINEIAKSNTYNQNTPILPSIGPLYPDGHREIFDDEDLDDDLDNIDEGMRNRDA